MPSSECGIKGFGSSGVNIVTPATKKITCTDHKEDIDTNKYSYKTGKGLDHFQKESIKNLVHQFENIFTTNFKDVKGLQTKHYHDIDW